MQDRRSECVYEALSLCKSCELVDGCTNHGASPYGGFCIVAPHTPRLDTQYCPGCFMSSIVCSCAGYVVLPPCESVRRTRPGSGLGQ